MAPFVAREKGREKPEDALAACSSCFAELCVHTAIHRYKTMTMNWSLSASLVCWYQDNGVTAGSNLASLLNKSRDYLELHCTSHSGRR